MKDNCETAISEKDISIPSIRLRRDTSAIFTLHLPKSIPRNDENPKGGVFLYA